MTDTLLRTKLYVPQRPVGRQRPSLVPRPHLIDKLNAGLAGKLILISAPAGCGKTTLIADWRMRIAESSTIPYSAFRIPKLCWLSLDDNDNDPTRFLAYLIAALQTVEPDLGETAVSLLQSPQPPPTEAILTSLINDIAAADAKHFVLALDDYHQIVNTAVHQSLAFLLENMPTSLHLIILTRADPPLPLARWRARGQMCEIRQADLRFTQTEAAAFLNEMMGLDLTAAQVEALEERTEGWIAGLQLAALSLRGRADKVAFIQAFSGSHRFVMDYLADEVLQQQDEETRRFLVETAVLDRLTAPLCDAVTGRNDSQSILARLEQDNLFIVPLDDDRQWYRYHRLFADLLRARLQQTEPNRDARLLSRAAAWCEQNGQVVDAIGYALAAQDYQQGANLVAKYWQRTMNKGEIETVYSWLNALPQNVVRNSAPLSVANGWALWIRGQIGEIETHLAHAADALDKRDASPEGGEDSAVYATLPAELAVLRSFVARHHNEFETATAHAERAISLMPEYLSPQTNAQLRSLIYLAQASAYDGEGDLPRAAKAYAKTIRWSRSGASAAGVAGTTYRLVGALRLLGRLQEAKDACHEALAYLKTQGMACLPAAGILHLALSEVLVEQNDLQAAEAHLSQGIALGKWSGRLDAVRNAAPTLVRLRLACGDEIGAVTAVEEAEAALGEPPSPLAKAELLALKARIRVRQGALNEAARCIGEAKRLAGWDRGQNGEMVVLAASRLQLAQDKPETAITGLTQSITTAEASGRIGALIELLILRSLARIRQGSAQKAETDLERALTVAEPEGYVRVFLDEGQPMQKLLTQWQAHADPGPLRDYASHLLSQFDAEWQDVAARPQSASSTSRLAETLSHREVEVLQLIAQGKTNKEVARQLIIAPGTVKAHTASVYRKLDVANRTEAVTRARQLGILP